MTPVAHVRAHAKLTLSLRVLGRRDDGFHDVDGLVVSLADLADDVGVSLRSDARFTIALDGVLLEVPRDQTNLAMRAARALVSRVRPHAGADVLLHKRIPAAAGLGGGSADAAGVLHATAALLAPDADHVDLADLAAIGAEIGSDVPFCVRGGLARMRGRGEVLEPLPLVEGWWVAIAVPPFSLPTPRVYAAWDRMGGPRSDRVVAPPPVLAPIIDALVNDLEPAALDVEPRLSEFRDDLEARCMRAPLLAGSGPAYFVLFDDPGEADDVVRRALSGLDARLAVVSGPGAAGVTGREG